MFQKQATVFFQKKRKKENYCIYSNSHVVIDDIFFNHLTPFNTTEENSFIQ